MHPFLAKFCREQAWSSEHVDFKHQPKQLKIYPGTHDNPKTIEKLSNQTLSPANEKTISQHFHDLPEQHKLSLSAYAFTHPNHLVNKHMRTSFGKHEDFEKNLDKHDKRHLTNGGIKSNFATNLKQATNSKIPEPMTLYRGSKSHPSAFPVGSKFVDHGFASTTLKPQVAAKFHTDPKKIFDRPQFSDAPQDKHNTIFQIHAPAGTKMTAPEYEGFHYPDDNQELLLHHGTHFEVTHHSKTPEGTHVIHAKITHQDE